MKAIGSARLPRVLGGAISLLVLLGVVSAAPAQAETYVPISGSGSTWSQNALDQWIRNVSQYGMKVNYGGTGSSDGRNQFRNNTVDFAVSEIPYGLSDRGVVDQPPSRKFAYMPIVAGGTSLMYNLKIGGQRVTSLRLSGETVAKIFTGGITSWDDPAIKADNPALALPARKIVPVVRSDGSGTTAQFTTWLSKKYPQIWDPYCAKAGRPTPCGVTSNYPVVTGTGFTAQAGSTGVAGYVRQAQSEGAITYVEYSYAVSANFPVVKLLNASGYYVAPTAKNVAVGLLGARINTDAASSQYLTQNLDGVYASADPRAYPLSSYSYMVVPTAVEGNFNAQKGKTLGDFSYYFLCEGQQQAEALGYSPLPINLVQAGLDQVRRIPGVDVQAVNIAKCNNPTFSADGTNTLAKTAPQPPACDKQGPTQCEPGSATAAKPVAAAAATGAKPAAGAAAAAGAGTAASAGSAAATADAAAADPAAATSTAVDPETGELVAGEAVTAGGAVVAGATVELPPEGGWGQEQTLVLLAVALLLGLVLGPPLLGRSLGRREGQ
jgi:phosphate ABC transporter phosphate-binding protein